MHDETELDDDLVEVVLAEALESLESALWTLRALDHGPQGGEVVASLFRCFHSIKGNTAMAGRGVVSKLAHRVENVLDVIRAQNRPLNSEEGSRLTEIVDALYPLIEADAVGADGSILEGALCQFEALHSSEAKPRAGRPELEADSGAEDRVISFPTGGSSFAGAPASEQAALDWGGSGDSKAASSGPGSSPTAETPASSVLTERGEAESDSGSNKLRVDAQSVLGTMTIAGELFQIDERLKYLVRMAAAKGGSDSYGWEGMQQLSREFDVAVERLYGQLLDIQRLPVSQLTGPLERSVRDICRKTGKNIEFVIHGRELRIDKQVVQTLKDPLMHMVRNACDHGVETPAERLAVGKSARATVTLEFRDADDRVEVLLRDDGRGMNVGKIKQKAIEQGLVNADGVAGMSDQQAIQFILHPGFSTADTVSELSGRGVGMDVVANAIAGGGGVLQIKSAWGQGSQFLIELPKLGSPVVDGLAVRSGSSIYLIPLKNVLCFVARSGFRLLREPGGVLFGIVHNKTYRLSRLPGGSDVSALRNARAIAVLTEDRAGGRVLVLVDEVLGRRKALVQELRYDICQKARQTGVAILGDGSIGFTVAVEEFSSPNLALQDREWTSLEVNNAERELACAS